MRGQEVVMSRLLLALVIPALLGARALGQSASTSTDGRFLAISSASAEIVPNDTNGVADVFVHDRRAGATWCVSVGPDGATGNGPSACPWISRDGRFVVFWSAATDL